MADQCPSEKPENPWNSYLNILSTVESEAGPVVMEAAIVGQDGCVWSGQGSLLKITPNEVKTLTTSDRTSLLMSGPFVGGVKCAVIRDWFNEDGTMHLRTISTHMENTYNIFIAKTKTALIIVKGHRDVHGAKLVKKTMYVAEYLQSQHI